MLASVIFQFTPLREGRQGYSPCLLCVNRNFNSRPSARGDIGFDEKEHCNYISIHAPPRGATPRIVSVEADKTFQFTPLREGRRCPSAERSNHLHFNSRPSARGDGQPFAQLKAGAYFNSRPSARGDDADGKQEAQATYFNSRPSARGDFIASCKSLQSAKFQFTPLREGRPRHTHLHSCIGYISIHAPPRGATTVSVYDSPRGAFQFTPLREGRPQKRPQESLHVGFQFTPLREGRLEYSATLGGGCQFQFTPLREGRRCEERGSGNRQDISIHAPPRGATQVAKCEIRCVQFQFTPLREGRQNGLATVYAGTDFNSRPSARGDKWSQSAKERTI